MGSLSLEFKVSPGEHISYAAQDLCRAADRVGVRCCARFNGVMISAEPGSQLCEVVNQYYRHTAELATQNDEI